MKKTIKKTSSKKTPSKVQTRIDVTGTAPGVVKAEPQIIKVRMSCVSPCDSTEFAQVDVGSSGINGHRVYRCLKCGRVKSLNVGGSVNI